MIVISKTMVRKYKSNKKLLLLPPLVDINDEIWHQKIEKSEDEFTFCFAGFPGGNKESLDKVVEAFNKLNYENAILKIVGLTEKDFCEMYSVINQNDNIRFLGYQNHESSIKNILDCDCYVFIRPSDRRNNAGFPTKFVESFTCGVPIITTDVSDIKEFIDFFDGSVLLKDCNIENIQKAMETILEKRLFKKSSGLKK